MEWKLVIPDQEGVDKQQRKPQKEADRAMGDLRFLFRWHALAESHRWDGSSATYASASGGYLAAVVA